MFSPFQDSPSEPPIPSPSLCLYEGDPPPTHPLLPSRPGIPLNWGIKPPQTQGLFLTLMSNKAILCHIRGWNHGSSMCTFWLVVQSPGAPEDLAGPHLSYVMKQ